MASFSPSAWEGDRGGLPSVAKEATFTDKVAEMTKWMPSLRQKVHMRSAFRGRKHYQRTAEKKVVLFCSPPQAEKKVGCIWWSHDLCMGLVDFGCVYPVVDAHFSLLSWCELSWLLLFTFNLAVTHPNCGRAVVAVDAGGAHSVGLVSSEFYPVCTCLSLSSLLDACIVFLHSFMCASTYSKSTFTNLVYCTYYIRVH